MKAPSNKGKDGAGRGVLTAGVSNEFVANEVRIRARSPVIAERRKPPEGKVTSANVNGWLSDDVEE